MNQSDRKMSDFLADLASRAATPGGGSASALVGAVAAALCGMVGRLNDKKDGAAGPLHDTIAPADALLARMQALMDEDIAAFNELAATWKLPDGDPAAAVRKQAAVQRATESPLQIMECAVHIMRLAAEGLALSKKNCLSDAGVAGICAHAALEGARLNVMINLPGIQDGAGRDRYAASAETLREEAMGLRRHIDELIAQNYR